MTEFVFKIIILSIIVLFIIWTWLSDKIREKIKKFLKLPLKIIWTIFLIVLAYSIATSQVDPKSTLENFLEKQIKKRIDIIATREQDAIYQNDKIVARLGNGEFKKENKTIYFNQLEYSNELNLDEIFEFQKYILQFISYKAMIQLDSSQSHKGRILKGVSCRIIDLRL